IHVQPRRSRTVGSTVFALSAEPGTARGCSEWNQIPQLPSPGTSAEADRLFLVEDEPSRGTNEPAAYVYGFSNVVQKVAFPVCQEKGGCIAAGVAHQECRGDATADAAHRAIAVHFTRAGVHHAEIALAVDDFSGQLHFAKLDIRDTLSDCTRE